MLLAEIARSLRETHPQRAEEMIAALERRMPPDWVEPPYSPMTADEMMEAAAALERRANASASEE